MQQLKTHLFLNGHIFNLSMRDISSSWLLQPLTHVFRCKIGLLLVHKVTSMTYWKRLQQHKLNSTARLDQSIKFCRLTTITEEKTQHIFQIYFSCTRFPFFQGEQSNVSHFLKKSQHKDTLSSCHIINTICHMQLISLTTFLIIQKSVLKCT